MKNIKKIDCILVSFDYKKEDTPKISYAISSLILYSKERGINIENFSLDMGKTTSENNLINEIIKFDLNKLKKVNYIAISCYVWGKEYVNMTIDYLKKIGFKGKIILGGYEITYNRIDDLKKQYNKADKFLSGFAEESLLNFIKNGNTNHDTNTDITSLPLIYSSNTIILNQNMKVNLETKRGCPYKCSFCAHRDLNEPKVYERNFQDIKKELIYLNKVGVKKVNFIDPIFNMGENYLNILKFMLEIDFKPIISFQVRFEFIRGEKGDDFLKYSQKLNVILEFGLQTIIPEEYNIIRRKNKKEKISNILNKLNKLNIKYEVSLIYGLPRQTVSSFKESIDFLEDHSCKKIIAFPLMLLSGTELFFDREKYNLSEKKINDIDYVVSSDSFSEEEYLTMKNISELLGTKKYSRV